MNTIYPIRHSVRIVLLNDGNELLLMCIDNPKIKAIGKKYNGRFWTLIGGQIESNETIQEAATRELFEETRLSKEDVNFGPIVWFGEFGLILNDKPTSIDEKFIVARTKKKKLSLDNLMQDEMGYVKHLDWFSLDRITNSRETIYPIRLSNYLPDILAGKYPKEPLRINFHQDRKY